MDGLILLLLSVHTLATVMMTGIVWFVQLVHYPLMERVSEERFTDYEKEHKRRTSWIIVPLMILEAATAAALLAVKKTETFHTFAWVGLGLVVILWLTTFLVQMPLHARLSKGFDHGTWSWLVGSNWIRTATWSLRSFIVLLLIVSI